MNYWKIKNTCKSKVRFVISGGPSKSTGIVLMPNECIICNPKQTPSMDAQIRRNFVDVVKDFDNEIYGLEIGKVYSEQEIEQKKVEKSNVV